MGSETEDTGLPGATGDMPPEPRSGRRRIGWHGAVISCVGIAFAANLIMSYEWGWEVTPWQVLAGAPRVGVCMRSDGRYLVVSGTMGTPVVVGEGRAYAVLVDPVETERAADTPRIAVYFRPGVEVPGTGRRRSVALAGRIARTPPEAVAILKLSREAPCLIVGAGRFRSVYFWTAVILGLWGMAMLVRSLRARLPAASPPAASP